MTFPPQFLDELRARLPVSEVVGKRVRLIRAGREFKACCPFHNEKSPSFTVNDEKGFYHCFGCGANGNIISFSMQYERLSFPEAVEQLAALAGMEVPRDTPVEREHYDRQKRLYELLDRATKFFEEELFAPGGREALNYLRSRGLSEDGIRRFRLGYAPNNGQALIRKMLAENYKLDEMIEIGLAKKSDERGESYSFFRNRVIFPVGDRKGRTVAFGGRVMGDGEPKYLNSPDHPLFHKGKLLYGLSRARTAISQNQPLIVVEGYMDVIALAEAGYSGAVAPLGTALTEDQLIALWKLLPPIESRDPSQDYSPILCFDGDAAGQRAAIKGMERALPMLLPGQTVRIATLPQGQDPDDLIRQSGRAAMDGVLSQAKPMIDMIWDTTLANRRMHTPEDKAAFQNALKQKVSRISDAGLRSHYLDDISKRLEVIFGRNIAQRNRSRPQNRSLTPYKGKSKNWQDESPQGLTPVSRNKPPSAQRLREKTFLALMINYPALFDEFGEEFAQMSFAAPEFEVLKQRLAAILALDSSEPLDVAGLYRHLSTSDDMNFGSNFDSAAARKRVLDDVLSENTYMHTRAAHPGGAIETARHAWKSVNNNLLKEKLNNELEKARLVHMQENSDESYARMMAILEQIQSHVNDDSETGFTETHRNSGVQES